MLWPVKNLRQILRIIIVTQLSSLLVIYFLLLVIGPQWTISTPTTYCFGCWKSLKEAKKIAKEIGWRNDPELGHVAAKQELGIWHDAFQWYKGKN